MSDHAASGAGATAEHARLAEATGRAEDDLFAANPWYEWGPYLSERAWGTVREDYSADGDAWSFFPHDHARSRAYRWNEDGMAGLSDIHHDLCLALSLWNGADPILKERMFGLTGPQGNHGEDAKEYWWYLDGLPSHALLQWRYHYPQAEFPYQRLIDENARRGRDDFEFELLDTGVFDDGRYWIVDVTYAKATSDRGAGAHHGRTTTGPTQPSIDVLPTMWFRNTWRWSESDDIPRLSLDGDAVVVDHPRLGGYRLEAAPAPDGTRPKPLFCDNETNTAAAVRRRRRSRRIPRTGSTTTSSPAPTRSTPRQRGTKAAWWYHLTVPGGGSAELRLRLSRPEPTPARFCAERWSATAFDDVSSRRRAEADEFYAAIAPDDTDPERMRILRQACAGLIWSKQMYPYRVTRWLDGDPTGPPPPRSTAPAATPDGGTSTRSTCWRCRTRGSTRGSPPGTSRSTPIPWAHLDPAFAKYQLIVLLREWFLHPNGALPAYEWNFDDVNPPVHALAALRVFVIDGGQGRRVPRARLPEARPQLHVVAQPPGPRREQPLRWRLPRARQHQPDRPLAPATRDVGWSRPTGRRGWRTTPRPCWSLR